MCSGLSKKKKQIQKNVPSRKVSPQFLVMNRWLAKTMQ
ncbi:hypothetical protein SSYIS1_26650 [Serratia symbiotica]|uniref:Uncharacterized protein n=1 Tax=Serratia symbiotica TaxID=138074 RepID=A0A455VS66_9GAMM|nr:hypothetical protein SSYIS1_26650 [Serratia symbiotica]